MADAVPQNSYCYVVKQGPTPIEGSSTDAHLSDKKAFELQSYVFKSENSMTVGSTAGGGKVRCDPIEITKIMDKADAGLLQMNLSGEFVGEMVIETHRNNKRARVTTLKQVVIKSFEFSQAGDEEAITKAVLDWGAMKQEFFIPDPQGNPKKVGESVWSRITNQAAFEVQ